MGSPLYIRIQTIECGVAAKRRKSTSEGENQVVCRKCVFDCFLGLESTKTAYRTKRRRSPIRNVALLHDNPRPHTAAITQVKLEEMHWEQLERPPYSLYVSPCDYHSLGPPKKALGRERFENNEKLIKKEQFLHNWLLAQLMMQSSSIIIMEINFNPLQDYVDFMGNVERYKFLRVFVEEKAFQETTITVSLPI
ncbi:hypothetical protein NQ318_021223 [Aromia moschata]|uniref:Histone-lysine N-methyltransferase SETMAR n=1 Tax=Aromia moschata TaxID=1265417 RepID=A0AAV8XZ03_9CUCU|nr:hypothetical protein NQ318_021223 [Aromia moschata]